MNLQLASNFQLSLPSSPDHQHPGNLKHVTVGVLHFQVQIQLTHSQAAREPSRYHREPSHHLRAGRHRYCLDKSHWFRSLAAEKADRCTVYTCFIIIDDRVSSIRRRNTSARQARTGRPSGKEFCDGSISTWNTPPL